MNNRKKKRTNERTKRANTSADLGFEGHTRRLHVGLAGRLRSRASMMTKLQDTCADLASRATPKG